jgi:SHS family lactate transporter-like MFS transporter
MIGAAAPLLALLTWLGPEAHGVGFGKERATS